MTNSLVEKLTILIFLKDRANFTRRLIHYLSQVNYPFEVYFADGSLGDENELIFKNLNAKFRYRYQRYPKDLKLDIYFQKCVFSISEIRTPYVMLVDNDDFPIQEGQLKAIEFLERKHDYVGCNGQVAGIELSVDSGKPYSNHYLYHPYYCREMDWPISVEQEKAIERIKAYHKNFYSIFYSIFRTDSLSLTFEKIKEFNFSELGIVELFFSYSQLSQGKIGSIQELTYVRQRGSSQTAAAQRDWFYRLFYTQWLNDSKNAIKYIAEYIAQYEDSETEIIYAELYEAFVNRMRQRFLPNQPYFFKNVSYFFEKRNISFLWWQKLFKKYPAISEKSIYTLVMPKNHRNSFNLIREVVCCQNQA